MSTRAFEPAASMIRLSRGGGDSRWIIPAAALVLCQYVAAFVIGYAVGFFPRLPILEYMLISLVIAFFGGVLIALPKIWRLWREREPHPIGRLVREADLTAVASYLLGFQIVSWQMGALTWLKDMLPLAIPYWADPTLASIDRAILGTDAWRVVPAFLVRPFDIVYVTWMLVETIALIVILCLPPSGLKARSMLAYFLIVGIMGVCGQYLLSSAGPVFYDRVVGGNEFAGLSTLIDAHAPFAKMGANLLWESYAAHTDRMGNGISAMPSMHVATTAWMALMVSAHWPRLRIPVWCYWLAIFVGSFALGWHYFLDAVVGTLGALACWELARRLMQRGDGDLSVAGLALET